MGTIGQDLRHAFRMLARKPGFTVAAVVTLALGIGGNAAIFSAVNAVILRPLPFHDPDRLVAIHHTTLHDGEPHRRAPFPHHYREWERQNEAFEATAVTVRRSATLTGAEEPRALSGAAVSRNFFSLFGVDVATGRTFVAEEFLPEQDQSVILSHTLWQSAFGGREEALGKTIELSDKPHIVVGVMPPGFKFPPTRSTRGTHPQYWVPFVPRRDGKYRYFENIYGRLKPGVSLPQAQTEMDAIAAQLEQAFPDSYRGVGVQVAALQKDLIGDLGDTLLILWGAMGFVLLIACANLANLLLTRAAEREKEVAIRAALGAGRVRLLGHLAAESGVLVVLGGAAGWLVAYWGVQLLQTVRPPKLVLLEQVALDSRVFVFLVAASLLTGILFGLSPAWAASKPDVNQSLKGGIRATSGSVRWRTRNLLVLVETALALVLLTGAGLLMRSFLELQGRDLGVNKQNVLTFRFGLSPRDYPEAEQRNALFAQLLYQLRGLPGVEAASLSTSIPATDSPFAMRIQIEGATLPGKQSTVYNYISADFFDTFGIPPKAGRTFTEQEEADRPIVVVSERMAYRWWPGQNPIGKRIQLDREEAPRVVIGVVGDLRYGGLTREKQASIFLPYPEIRGFSNIYAVKTSLDPEALRTAIKNLVWSIDPKRPIGRVLSMEERFAFQVVEPRFHLALFGIFASLALVLAAVGIYGVVSYLVARRTHEMGVRLALGAQPRDLLVLVLRQGMLPVLLGIVFGLAGASALTKLIASFLFRVTPTDPFTFAGISALLITVALLACYLPARRATKVDPITALRYE